MAYNHFDYVPSSVSHNRSVFKFEKAIAGGCELGYLYPCCAPVRMLPGSSLKLNLAAEIRSGGLIAPLQDSLIVDFFAFKVPNRIVWEHWKQFLGSTDDVLFDNLTEYQIPSFKYVGFNSSESLSKPYVASHMLASWFELPMLNYRYNALADPKDIIRLNALPFRGYNFIWNEFFRPEQLVSPCLFSKTDNGWSGDNMQYTEAITADIGGNTITLITPLQGPGSDLGCNGGAVLPTFRVHKSLWTSCLPKPNLETVNLLAGLQAPVTFTNNGTSTVASAAGITLVTPAAVSIGDNSYLVGANSGQGLTNGPVFADLNAAVLTVNNYRETIMLDNYYQALNRAGSRYDELLRNLFHTNSSEAVIDIPELITHKRFTVFRKDVVATASSNYGPSDANTQTLGSQGAYIDTVVRDSFFTTSTTEHGFVHMMFTIRPSMIRMAQGIEPMWQQLDKFSQYYPQFDGMGDVPRYKKETYISSSIVTGDLDTILGFQEYGAEYKYTRNSAVNWADVYLTGHIPGLTLTEKLSAQPSLAGGLYFGIGSYISCLVEEDSFAKCLYITSPYIAPQFIVDIRLTGEIVHPMPVYNIPGMGDLL